MTGYLRFSALATLVVVLDQLTKFWIVSNFNLHASRTIIPGLFDLTYLVNTGVAFGMFAGSPAVWRQVFFIGVALAALCILIYMYRNFKEKSVFYELSLGLIAGGAIGNLIDRIRQGYVTDFLDVYIGSHHWPAFNVADSAISVGVGIFIVYSFFFEKKDEA